MNLLKRIAQAARVGQKAKKIKNWAAVADLLEERKRKFDEEEVKGIEEEYETSMDCRNETLINEIFGSVSEFCRVIETMGDDFLYSGWLVAYDEENDIHFFQKL